MERLEAEEDADWWSLVASAAASISTSLRERGTFSAFRNLFSSSRPFRLSDRPSLTSDLGWWREREKRIQRHEREIIIGESRGALPQANAGPLFGAIGRLQMFRPGQRKHKPHSSDLLPVRLQKVFGKAARGETLHAAFLGVVTLIALKVLDDVPHIARFDWGFKRIQGGERTKPNA